MSENLVMSLGKDNGVILKRVVTIKVIVTEQFKEYLIAEVKRALNNLEQQSQMLEKQANNLVMSTLGRGGGQTPPGFSEQLEMERQRIAQVKQQLQSKIEQANALELDSEFIQGTVDGMVYVKEGDNLYEKLGALEVTIKDGEVLKIADLEPHKKKPDISVIS